MACFVDDDVALSNTEVTKEFSYLSDFNSVWQSSNLDTSGAILRGNVVRKTSVTTCFLGAWPSRLRVFVFKA